MRHFLFLLILLLLLPGPASAAQQNIIVSYEPHASWVDNGSATWMDLDIGGTVASRRIAVALKAGNTEIIRLWDDPSNRTLPPVSFDMPGPRAKITGQTYAYEGGPWKASTIFAIDDKISVGDFPSANYYWQCTRVGTSGATEPTWPSDRKYLTSDYQPLADSQKIGITGSAVDNGDGTVTLQVGGGSVPTHSFVAGAHIGINGSTNYDSTYTLGDQSAGDDTHVVITATYVAETFDLTQVMYLTSGTAVDNGDGTVTIPCPDHGFVESDIVSISGTISYGDSFTLPAQTLGDADHFVVTATYAFEAFDSADKAYFTNGTIVDNGDGTVTLPVVGHGHVAGDIVGIYGTGSYDGIQTLPAQTLGDADNLVVTATYVLDFMDGSEFVLPTVEDPDTGGAQWGFVQAGQTVLESNPTGRIIVKPPTTGYAVQRSGTNFIRRSGP